jgi:ubiquitin C-terminal hydrolase
MCICCVLVAHQVKREAAINKRVALAQLPPTLVLHLNRFFLDLDTFSTVKLNTAFEFPRRLNVEEYTKEGLAWREGSALHYSAFYYFTRTSSNRCMEFTTV